MTKTKDDPLTEKEGVEGLGQPPNMGEGEALETGTEPGAQKGGTGDDELKIVQDALVKRGLKSVKDLVSSLDEKERKVTELSKNARVQSFIPPYMAPPPGPVGGEPEVDLPEDVYAELSDNAKARKFLTKFRGDIENSMTRKFQTYERAKEINRIAVEVDELLREDPKKFRKLKQRMIELSEMPEYRNAGVQFLYKKAEEIEAEEREELKNELRKDILGTDIDSQKLKALINKIKPAPIVGEGGGGGGTGAPEEEVKEAEKKLKEAIFGTHKS